MAGADETGADAIGADLTGECASIGIGAKRPAGKSFVGMLYGCTLGAVAFLAPVVGVRRGWAELLNHWAELCVLASCVLAGGLIVGRWTVQHRLERLESAAESSALEAAKVSAAESSALEAAKVSAAKVSATDATQLIGADAVPTSVTQEVDLADVSAIEAGVNAQTEKKNENETENVEIEKLEQTEVATPSNANSDGSEKLTGTAATAVVVRGKEREQTKVEKRIRLIVSPERTKRTGGFVFLLLYINCAVLCQRLNFGMFSITPDVANIFKIMGVSFAILGALYIAIYDKLTPNQRVLHPNYFGVLLILLGVPFVFSTWFPLLALPGIFVGMLWSLRKLNGDTALVSAQSRKLIPFFY